MIKHTASPTFICLPLLAMFLPNKARSGPAKQRKIREMKQENDNDSGESLPIRLRGLS
jgi:hypothetical protein